MEHINYVVLVGNLTRDPEQRPVGSSQVTKFSLAINGIKPEDVCFLDITCWGELANKAAMLQKGQQVTVVGRLKQDTWQDKMSGEQRSRMNVVASEVCV